MAEGAATHEPGLTFTEFAHTDTTKQVAAHFNYQEHDGLWSTMHVQTIVPLGVKVSGVIDRDFDQTGRVLRLRIVESETGRNRAMTYAVMRELAPPPEPLKLSKLEEEILRAAVTYAHATEDGYILVRPYSGLVVDGVAQGKDDDWWRNLAKVVATAVEDYMEDEGIG